MNEKIVNMIGQNLVAIGLYTVAFESMVLSFRQQMYGHLHAASSEDAEEFSKKHCKTADQTFKFCTPVLISHDVLNHEDVNALDGVRRRRNHFAHAGYDEMLDLQVKDVDDDVLLMHRISRKVGSWMQQLRPVSQDGSVPFTVSPNIFMLYRSAAVELAARKLLVEDAPV